VWITPVNFEKSTKTQHYHHDSKIPSQIIQHNLLNQYPSYFFIRFVYLQQAIFDIPLPKAKLNEQKAR